MIQDSSFFPLGDLLGLLILVLVVTGWIILFRRNRKAALILVGGLVALVVIAGIGLVFVANALSGVNWSL